MTGNAIIELANSIVEDSIPTGLAVSLLNNAKNRRERMRPWQMTQRLDSSQTANPSDTWQTAKSLPTGFRSPRKMYVGRYTQYTGLPFDQLVPFQDSAQRFAVDTYHQQFFLTGRVNTAQTIYLYFNVKTADYTEETLDQELLVWPEEFHPLTAFDMAAQFQGGVDYDDVSARMSPENRAEAKRIEDSMIAWDMELALSAMGDSFAGNGEAEVDLGMM